METRFIFLNRCFLTCWLLLRFARFFAQAMKAENLDYWPRRRS